jgi:DNA-binding NarL/FixJ family response regulator
MLTQGLSNKDIATLTLTTTRNIEKHRLNLRKKLKLKRNDDLIKVIRTTIS